MRNILLIISGSVAAYKALELIRRLREDGYVVTPVLTKGGEAFITPLSAASLAGNPCYTELFSLKDETEMGHIRLAREADLVVAAPASADLLAKMATGRADDLASAILLATQSPIMAAPAMNHAMWDHPATQRNVAQLKQDGVHIIEPGEGELACGEIGAGRMAELENILEAIRGRIACGPLAGKKILVTSGPTYEPIDPVRFLGNRSSGKQGHAIASALAATGAEVTLVSGPVSLPDPAGVKMIKVHTAEEMFIACKAALPMDIAVCAAAVSDWKPARAQPQKQKKQKGKTPQMVDLIETPDILAFLSKDANPRPQLVIGFAAETESLEAHAKEKRLSKGCDWIVANDVKEGVFGADENEILFIDERGSAEAWPRMSKTSVARALVERILSHYEYNPSKGNIRYA